MSIGLEICIVIGIAALLSTAGYLWKNWEDTLGKMQAMYKASTPNDNYAEASFDNWLDWFTIAPEKWCFLTKSDYTWNQYETRIPVYLTPLRNGGNKRTFIKFSYADFKKFVKWYERRRKLEQNKAQVERENKKRRKAEQNTVEMLKNIQQDIAAYKAKVDAEMARAVDTCRDVTNRIANGGQNNG